MNLKGLQLIYESMTDGVHVSDNGTKSWTKNGLLHRLDGPAIVYPDGSEKWYRNGVRHRDGGPASIYKDGATEWWNNGVLHREDGPAVTYKNDKVEYYLNGNHLTKADFDKWKERQDHLKSKSKETGLDIDI